VGWVSILDPEAVCRSIDVPPSWSLVAYLCVGLPIEEHAEPELERAGWEQRESAAAVLLQR
jgi:5,6-dimethylbenzimidazole synthase